MGAAVPSDRWHELLTSRYVCAGCLTRYFTRYRRCPACKRNGRVVPLSAMMWEVARNDGEWREMVAGGGKVATHEHE